MSTRRARLGLVATLLAATTLGTTTVAARRADAGRTLDGAVVYQQNCGRCHMPRTPGDLSPAGWRAAAFHMLVKANLTPSEFSALELFLAPAARPTAGAQAVASTGVETIEAITTTCLVCHDSTRIQDAVDSGRTAEQWAATLARMRTYGAKLDASQAESLTQELTKTATSTPE